ncbi:MAG: hypothetical protein FJ218_03565 [Ignavibacteria bacterium]|nr:hypothetical protein [Ignavibacteria bacterium]
MKKLNIQKEWQLLNNEVFEIVPIRPSSSNEVIDRKSLLLIAQSFLANYQISKSKKKKSFFAEVYATTMAYYGKLDLK